MEVYIMYKRESQFTWILNLSLHPILAIWQHLPHGSFDKKINRCVYYLRYLLFGLYFGNTVMQSHFARGPQLRVISVTSELYFVASGSVLSRVFYFLWTMAQPKKQVRILHDRLKIIEKVEKNPEEKRVDIAKRLGLSVSTLNSIFAKKDEIRKRINVVTRARSRHLQNLNRCSSPGISRRTHPIFQLMEPHYGKKQKL